MTLQPYALAEGEHLKADKLALLEARREIYVNRGRLALLQTLLAAGSATADDVRELVELPPGINAKCFGAVPGPLARAGIIRAVGFDKTCRPVGHARPVSVWKLVDRIKAERWLRDHPDQPDLGDNEQPPAVQSLLFPLSPTNEPGATVAAATPGME